MAFQKATIARFERVYENDQLTRVFVAIEISDDAIQDERKYAEFWVEGEPLAEMETMTDADGNRDVSAQRDAFIALIRPQIQAAYDAWQAEIAARPVIEVLDRAGVEETWGTAEITTLS